MKLSLLLLSTTVGTFALCDLCLPASSTAASITSVMTRAMPSPLRAPSAQPRTVTLRIKGMTCGGCTVATRKVLERLDGVQKAEVSYENGTAVVTYDSAKVTVAQMIAAVATLKYTATVVTS